MRYALHFLINFEGNSLALLRWKNYPQLFLLQSTGRGGIFRTIALHSAKRPGQLITRKAQDMQFRQNRMTQISVERV